MPLYLNEKETPTIPPTGIRELFVDTDGSVKQLKSDGSKAAIGGGTGDTWFDAAVASMKTNCPAMAANTARFEYIKVGQRPNGALDSAISVDGASEGGSLGVASDTTYLKFASTVWQTPRTVPLALAFQCKFPAIAAAKTSLIGAVTIGNVLITGFGWDQATSGTKWLLVPSGSATVVSTVNADTLWHTGIITVDVANSLIIATMDGVEIARAAGVASLTNSPSGPGAFSSATLTPGVLINRIAYGYVDPTS